MGKYLDKIREREPAEGVPSTERPPPASLPTLHPGSLVCWRRGDGTVQEGFVDAIHVDDTGTRWAFVSLPGGTWSAVNVKFLKEVNP